MNCGARRAWPHRPAATAEELRLSGHRQCGHSRRWRTGRHPAEQRHTGAAGLDRASGREAAYSAADIGTATPLSNNATLFSYPREDGANPMPDEAATVRLDRVARRAKRERVVDVPTAHGFCVYLRRDC